MRALSLVMCLPSGEGGVAILFGEIVFHRFRGVVQQVATQGADLGVGQHLLVHHVVGPASQTSVEQAQAPVRIAFAMAQVAAEKAVASREAVGAPIRCIHRLQDRQTQFRTDAFVGINAQHPVVPRLRNSELFLRAETAPVGMDHSGSATLREFHAAVVATRVDDHDLIAKIEAGETGGQLCGCVAGNQNRRERWPGSRHESSIIRSVQAYHSIRKAPEPAAVKAKPIAPPRAVLLVKTSSLGDVVHNLALVSDLRSMFPEVLIDWVVEEALVGIPRLHPAVRRVIPVGLRRWRKALLSGETWREIAAFRRDLQTEAYDVVLDTQGLIKSGLVVRQARLAARGRRCGYGAEAAREPLAARFYDAGFAIPKNLHAVERNRWLGAAVFGYVADMQLDYGLGAATERQPESLGWLPVAPYVVLLTATSRDDKLWPEEAWLTLASAFAASGLTCVLPAGTALERQRATRLGQGMSCAVVAPEIGVGELATLCRGARLVVGLDTGLTHLAVALGRPTLALFSGSDPQLTGVFAGENASAQARNLGASGSPPTAAEAIAVSMELLA